MTAMDADPAAQAFVSQARECEIFASNHPRAYRWRVAGAAIFGYIFPPAVLLILVAVFAAIFWFLGVSGFKGGGFELAKLVLGKLAYVLIVLIAMVARAMWPSFSKPDGVRLRRRDAPELFSFIDDLRGKTGNPRIHRLYVTEDMNAAVLQTPRIGLFGWYRTDLILGLPLMQALTQRELAAVIAHEFGHLSGAHGKLGAWIYRSRMLMARILDAIEEKKYFGSWIFKWFYRWYEPFFAAYSFALAREQEYEADITAATAVSNQALVDALARISIADAFLSGTFWEEVWEDAHRQTKPPKRIYGKLGKCLASLSTWDGTSEILDAIIASQTDHADTHPSLSDRAGALDIEPRLPPAANDAGTSLLPNDGADLEQEFSRHWETLAAEHWDEQHKELQEKHQRLAELDATAENGALTKDDAMIRGYLAEHFMGSEAALTRFEQALAWSDGADEALFAKGRVLLNLDRDEGLDYLNQAMDRNSDAIVPGCQLAETYLAAAGRDPQAKTYRRRREAHEELLQADWTDRGQLTDDDTFVLHDCGAEKLADIVRIIDGFKKKGVKKAWLVRKVTQHRQWEAAYFLICDPGAVQRWSGDINKQQAELSELLACYDDLVVLICDANAAWLTDKATAVPNAQIYSRS